MTVNDTLKSLLRLLMEEPQTMIEKDTCLYKTRTSFGSKALDLLESMDREPAEPVEFLPSVAKDVWWKEAAEGICRDCRDLPTDVAARFMALIEESARRASSITNPAEPVDDGTWRPKEDDVFYTIDPKHKEGIDRWIWNESHQGFQRLLERKLVFLTREGAMAKAREIGWIE